jgi:hypothetical protein
MGYEGLEAGSEVFAHFQGSDCCCLHLARDNLKKRIVKICHEMPLSVT